MLDEIHGMLMLTKKSNKEMADEIDRQVPMIKDLEKNIDGVQGKIKRAHNKLNQYFEQSSSGCLMTTVCLQIKALLLIIFAI